MQPPNSAESGLQALNANLGYSGLPIPLDVLQL